MINHIQIPKEYVRFANYWLGSSSSMLYAIASTGNLTTGTVKPVDCETDEDWYLHLWELLSCELCSICLKYPNMGAERFSQYVDDIIEELGKGE